MRRVQPKMVDIREQFADDKQKQSQAMMELYKKEKINPMGGCLPILVQMPVFIGLYWMLMESVELRQAPFILWIKDLAVMDPYFVLPLMMGASMFYMQKLNPPAARSNAGENYAVDASYVYLLLPLVSGWAGFVLGRQ